MSHPELEKIDFKIINILTAEQAQAFKVIPYSQDKESISVAVPSTLKKNLKELEFLTGKSIRTLTIPDEVFRKHITQYYPENISQVQKTRTDLKGDSDVIRFVRGMLEEAAALNASDIHVERYESFARVRFRWEGQMLEKYEIPLEQYNAIVSRIKILAELDISERRLPQDGRIHFVSSGEKTDVRVSTIPSRFGEKVVMRLLRRNSDFLKLENLGMGAAELKRFRESLHQQNGIILVTGPTGSGKTTTLYAALSLLNQTTRNILTIEDPIEYNIEGINQVQTKEEIGLDFGTALRAYLRQDPDIIMVGEIRDKETAEIAIRAALTGHLVFSTLHTNSSWDAVTRLMDMGIEPYLLSSSLRLLAAQRLIRILCTECRQKEDVKDGDSVCQTLGIQHHFSPHGCPACQYTGYSKRKAIYEVLPINTEIAGRIRLQQAEISDLTKKEGILSLRDHVTEMLRSGETSLEEAFSYLTGF